MASAIDKSYCRDETNRSKGGSFIRFPFDTWTPFWRKKGRGNQSIPSLYTFHYIFTKNASCIRIESNERASFLISFYNCPPPLLLYFPKHQRRRARVPFDLIEFDRDRAYNPIYEHRGCITCGFLPTIASHARVRALYAAPGCGDTSIEISVARFSLWTRNGWEFVAFQSVLAHANFRDCFVRRTVAGQRHPCRGWQPGEGRKKRKERLKGERRARERERKGRRRRRRRKEGPVSVLFRVIATRTEASKGFVLRFHSWVALRGLLFSALFCASFFLIDGRVNRSCSPRLENACRLQFPLLHFRRGATRGQFNVTGVNADEKPSFFCPPSFFSSFLPFFFFFSFSSPSLDSLLCHLQWLVDAGWRRGHLASEEYSHRWSRVYRRFLSSYAKHRGPLFRGISRGTSRCLESRNHASIFASLHTIPRNFAPLCILFDAGKTLMRGSLFLGIIEKGRRKGRRKS